MSYWWQRKWKCRRDLQCFGQEGLRCRDCVLKSHAWNNDSPIPNWSNSPCLPGHLETAAMPHRMRVGAWKSGLQYLQQVLPPKYHVMKPQMHESTTFWKVHKEEWGKASHPKATSQSCKVLGSAALHLQQRELLRQPGTPPLPWA